ncbi:MAG: alpha-ketoglutarate-dependent dioxygenase AlkB [Crocinitomicaceae bacterium]
MLEEIEFEQAKVYYCRQFLSEIEADHLMLYFVNQKESFWDQQEVKLFGKIYQSPRKERLICLDSSKNYSYSGNTLKTYPWIPELNPVLEKLSKLGYVFNAVLINFYRDGKDSNGWHADNEKELGSDPIIASVSLGAERRFQMKSKTGNEKLTQILHHGSLFLMEQGSQLHYKHQLPKMLKLAEPRINLTFRQIY